MIGQVGWDMIRLHLVVLPSPLVMSSLPKYQEIYRRFPAVEGQVYAVGGFNASYLRSGDKVLIPIRVGAGLRLGVNAGYMKFRKTQKWIPF